MLTALQGIQGATVHIGVRVRDEDAVELPPLSAVRCVVTVTGPPSVLADVQAVLQAQGDRGNHAGSKTRASRLSRRLRASVPKWQRVPPPQQQQQQQQQQRPDSKGVFVKDTVHGGWQPLEAGHY